MDFLTIQADFAAASATCFSCKKKLVPLWTIRGGGPRRRCANCTARICPIGYAMAFGTESDRHKKAASAGENTDAA